MEARKDKLRSLLKKDSLFFREVQEESKKQIEQKSRCISTLKRRGFPVVFQNTTLPFNPDAFLNTTKNSILTNLIRDFFKTKRGVCPVCGDGCRFERAHTIKERPAIAKEALDNVIMRNQDTGMFEMSEFLNEFIDLHEKYPIVFLCSECHKVFDDVIRKEVAMRNVINVIGKMNAAMPHHEFELEPITEGGIRVKPDGKQTCKTIRLYVEKWPWIGADVEIDLDRPLTFDKFNSPIFRSFNDAYQWTKDEMKCVNLIFKEEGLKKVRG
jgi:hypothetical protein